MIFSPYTILFFLLFLFGILFLFLFIQIGLITVAFSKIGLTQEQVFSFLIISLIGSHINIPIKRIESRTGITIPEQVWFWGMHYNVPKIRRETIISINLGGAIVPLCLSLYLMLKWGTFIQPLLGIAVVATASYLMARPVPGIGIALPIFVAPLMAALTALLLADGQHAPAVAYISGTMGTLIGADLLHMKDIPKIQAPVVSIGGAGTFDGIFLTGIIAVLLA